VRCSKPVLFAKPGVRRSAPFVDRDGKGEGPDILGIPMESNRRRLWLVLGFIALAGGIACFLFGSRDGVEAREAATQAVHDTAEQATGLGAVKAGEELKGSLRGLDRERQEQFQTLGK
jgi:hypothetical protein